MLKIFLNAKKTVSDFFVIHPPDWLSSVAYPGGWLAHLDDQYEEEMEENLRKIRKDQG